MPKRNHVDDPNSSDGEESNLINVDFDFFDPSTTDFITIKHLLSQLFQADAELLHIHELTELIIAQPLLGTTVKTDGIDSDPYAFITVLNMSVHQNHIAIRALMEYLLERTIPYPQMHQIFRELFSTSSSKQVGLILSQRLINMPAQVAPHMYRLLGDEIKWAVDENEPYSFTHYLCISRTYTPSSDEDQGPDAIPPPSKKLRSATSASGDAAKRPLSYHLEDELWENLSLHSMDYNLTKHPARGVHIGAKVMLMAADRFPELVTSMSQRFI